jgi:hypothetical protein
MGTSDPPDAATDDATAALTVPAAAPPLPPDLDVEALKRQLHCPNRRHARACHVLQEFGDATHGLGQVLSGQGRWIGNGTRVEKGAEKGDLFLLTTSGVQSGTVAPGDLPLRVAIGTMPKEFQRDGHKLVKALAHSETVSRNNKAFPFVKSWTSDNGRTAMSTTGPSIRLIAEEATYVRQAGQKVYVVKMRPMQPGVAATPGDGTYVELWPVTW